MNTQEYLTTPETVLPRELAYGVLRVADAPRAPHQRVVLELLLALAAFVRERHLGEVLPAPIDVILDFDGALVVQPDIVFVSSGRAQIVADQILGAPDLVVEVLSPHPRIGQLAERVGWFARYGVRECWLADLAARRIAVLGLGPEGVRERTRYEDRSPILPGCCLISCSHRSASSVGSLRFNHRKQDARGPLCVVKDRIDGRDQS